MKSHFNIDSEILQRYANGDCSPEEEALIDAWFVDYKSKLPKLELDEATVEADLADVWGRFELQDDRKIQRLPSWKKWLPIAASLLIVGTAAYYFSFDRVEQRTNKVVSEAHVSTTMPEPIRIKDSKVDVPAAENGAVLILSSGEKVYLNNLGQAESRSDHQVDIDLSSGEQISYKAGETANQQGSSATNTIIVPPGSVYKILLADGTKVSLNADSKLTFPIAFQGSKREVFLEGEAYFEVTKRTSPSSIGGEHQAFVVHAGSAAVNVLGTKFNVKAYRNDKKHSFTLEEGSIALSVPTSPAPLLLKPGQQALQVDKQLDIKEVDIDKELAWKSGDFYFDGETIQEIMSQISRWYAIDIHYMGPMGDQRYISNISRRKSLKEVLEILETTTNLKFSIQQNDRERRLMVIP
ncbi:FecR family protein [Sphingobacterium bambusae]|uniref:FecR family protein n=1 Tax=Sphingobacterium bambusae TaxID=662858 RepID=A0ABW6BLZ7_9SPHI|nr:FecR domain-containing protein [Sphingobacterium bambusae]WPL50987.1 DUF4974 domain-containing protein [Sphingobacterium bambusae]